MHVSNTSFAQPALKSGAKRPRSTTWKFVSSLAPLLFSSFLSLNFLHTLEPKHAMQGGHGNWYPSLSTTPSGSHRYGKHLRRPCGYLTGLTNISLLEQPPPCRLLLTTAAHTVMFYTNVQMPTHPWVHVHDTQNEIERNTTGSLFM